MSTIEQEWNVDDPTSSVRIGLTITSDQPLTAAAWDEVSFVIRGIERLILHLAPDDAKPPEVNE